MYRRRVPADLMELIGRGELVRSLRAESVMDARRIAALLDARVWRMFDALREGTAVNREEVDRLIDRLCGDYLRSLIEEDRRDRRNPVFDIDSTIDGIDWAMSEEAEALSVGRVEHVRPDALTLLAEAGKELAGSDLD